MVDLSGIELMRCKTGRTWTKKLEYLEHANNILTTSINVDSDRNWFAYSTRMQVRLNIADSVI